MYKFFVFVGRIFFDVYISDWKDCLVVKEDGEMCFGNIVVVVILIMWFL